MSEETKVEVDANTAPETEIDKYTTKDLIGFATHDQPVEFGDAFSALMQDRINVAVDAARVEVGASMFNSKE